MLFVIYLGKVETKLPAALIAIVVGSAVAWISGVMGFGAVQELSLIHIYNHSADIDHNNRRDKFINFGWMFFGEYQHNGSKEQHK